MASRNRPQKGESMLLQKKNKKKKRKMAEGVGGWEANEWMNEWMDRGMNEWMNGAASRMMRWWRWPSLPQTSGRVARPSRKRLWSISTGSHWSLPGFTGFYRVLPSFVSFCLVCTGLHRVLLGFAWFRWVLGFIELETGFYWISFD